MLGRRTALSLRPKVRTGSFYIGNMSEVIIYHAYNSSFPLPISGNGENTIVVQRISKLAKLFAVIGISLLIISFAPSFWYFVTTKGKDNVSELLYQTANAQPTGGVQDVVDELYQPRFDATLPKITSLKISTIGIDTEIYEATRENFEEALKKGVWRASDSGTPFNRKKPTILAAHRFGYLAWSNIFRRKHSFYNLPKLKVGDTVEITYKQRKYLYEVYAEDKGEQVSDYSADLILYTCEDLNSPIRIFKYARLIEV